MRHVLLLAPLLALAAPAGAAQTVDLVFEPPQVEGTDICRARVPDERLFKEWGEWDGKALPDRDPEILQRELARLLSMDPSRWADTVERAQALMPAIDPRYSAEKATLDRIQLFIATGRTEELKKLRLVEDLRRSDLAASPRMQAALAGYLMDGIGIAADSDAALDLMVQAAFGGNADALLKLTAMELAGQKVHGWDVEPELAVTMAFGALVGQLDPVICDRAGRIAREYLSGTIVTRNVELAERWYRFAADLGDASAAWKVAEMHLRSEDLTKDNDTLVTYLTKAADGGLPHALSALGRAYELGTIVPRDPDRARALHEAAAADGDRGGLIRLTLFLLQQQQDDPAFRPDYIASLERLAARDDAPSWALASLADAILQDKGRWAGEHAATDLLERAAAMGDTGATQRLTALRFRHVSSRDDFYAVVDTLVASVHGQGNIDPMAELQNAFTCRAPDAPHKDEAMYWRAVEDAAASRSLELSPQDIAALAENPDPLTLATLQSQALYGRPTAIANYITLLRRTRAPEPVIAFWEEQARRNDKSLLSAARLSVEEGETHAAMTGQRSVDVDLFRRAVQAGETAAGVDLAAQLLAAPKPAAKARIEALAALLPLAQSGNGAAMHLLPKADPVRWPALDAVWRDFAPVIEARGDFESILIALPRAGDEQAQADYLRRATATTACTFDQTILLTEVLGQMKAGRAFRQWIDITEFLAEGDGWRLTRLGDVLIRYGTPADADRAVAYFETAMADGSNTAIHRLLRHVARSELPSYDPDRATELYIELVRRSDPVELPRTLARLSGEEEQIRAATEAAIDVPALYRSAAEAGSPIGMREYARMLQSAADSPEELAAATDWMHRAAEAGDVEAMVSYAEALALGIGTTPSREDAVLWLSRAAELGSEQAAATMRNLRMSQGLSQ